MRLLLAIEWLTLAALLSGSMGGTKAAARSRQQRDNQQQLAKHRAAQAAANAVGEAAAATPSSLSSSSSATSANAFAWLGPEFMVVRRVYTDCQDKNDFVGCLKQKALLALTRAIDQDSIKIVDGLVLEKQNQTAKESIVDIVTDARMLNTLAPLDRALLAKVDRLVRTHTLKVDMTEARGHEGGGGGGGGHKKKHKGGGHVKYVIAALLTAMGIAGPIGLKALAVIAGKALVISKVALTIAGIIALKKLFSHDSHEETSFQVHAGDHNRRSTYVIKPVSKNASANTASAAISASVDPYRYYYEYH